jgi:hypothetical protein
MLTLHDSFSGIRVRYRLCITALSATNLFTAEVP